MLNLPFHVPVGHLYVFFGEFRSSAHDWVLLLLLNCMSCLYILEIKPLSVTCVNKYFSPSIDCIFVLFMVSCCAKACKFGKFHHLYVESKKFKYTEAEHRAVASRGREVKEMRC